MACLPVKVIFGASDRSEVLALLYYLGLVDKNVSWLTLEEQRCARRMSLIIDGQEPIEDPVSIIFQLILRSDFKDTFSKDILLQAQVIQWLEYGFRVVKSSLRRGQELVSIFELLNAALLGRCGMTKAALLKYSRVARWFDHVQYRIRSNPFVATRQIDMSQLSNELVEKAVIDISVNGESKKKEKKDSKSQKPTKVSSLKHDLSPFARVDLRIGRITAIEKHPHADRLYIETVDLGESSPRTVVSGLVEHVSEAELCNRLCLFICNLKPASICKVQSAAMLLVSKSEGDGVSLEPLVVPDEAHVGDRVRVEGIEGEPDIQLKSKENIWAAVSADLKVVNGTAMYQGKPLLVGSSQGKITSAKVLNGIVS